MSNTDLTIFVSTHLLKMSSTDLTIFVSIILTILICYYIYKK